MVPPGILLHWERIKYTKRRGKEYIVGKGYGAGCKCMVGERMWVQGVGKGVGNITVWGEGRKCTLKKI